ncbi:MAG: HtaA domain-containing protein, partial [Solirubrobacterales bacterium]
KAQLLAKQGVDVEGVRGADTTGRQTRLQIEGGTIGAGTAELTFDGALRFLAGEGKARRAVRLAALQAGLGPDSTLSGKLSGGKRRVLFDLKASGGLTTDASKGLAQLQGARLIWRRGAARALGKRLGSRIPRGSLGRIRISAATVTLGDDVITPKSGPLGEEPPLLPRPASAVDVTGGALTWFVRDSWIRYVNTEASPEALDGATAEPAMQENDHPCPDRPAGANPTLVYSYSFPFSNGWYDAASGTAALYYGGGIRFTYPSRGIDLATRNPEIEINGDDSRAIFRLRGAGETPYPDRRAPLLDLATSGPPSEGSPSSFGFPAPLRGNLTADGQNVFAGFYPPPNDGFGCLSVSFQTGS